MTSFRERFPPAWTVERLSAGYAVKDANGVRLLYVYAYEDREISRSDGYGKLSWTQAYTLAKAVASLGRA